MSYERLTDLHMPEGLTEAGQRAHDIIVTYLLQHGQTRTGGCKAFYSPFEWRASNEKYGPMAHLIIVYDSGGLRPVFSMDPWYRNAYDLYNGMQEKLLAAGLYFEECTRWCGTVHSVH